MPAGDGSLGLLALAALAAVAGAVVPFIVAHLITLAVITVVTVAGTAGIVQWMKRFSVAVMPERHPGTPAGPPRVRSRALPGRRPARALPAPQPRVTGAQKVIQGTVVTMAAGNQHDATRVR
jgi:hypothetical protein